MIRARAPWGTTIRVFSTTTTTWPRSSPSLTAGSLRLPARARRTASRPSAAERRKGLTKDPFKNDNLTGSLAIPTIFRNWIRPSRGLVEDLLRPHAERMRAAEQRHAQRCAGFPEMDLNYFTYGFKYLNAAKPCGGVAAPTTVPSKAVGDPKNSFCIDPNHIAPMTQYFVDVANGTLPSFAYIIPAYGLFDEHPGSGQSILAGQMQVAAITNALMNSPSWKDSVFFFSYDEGGGPLEHVPPVPEAHQRLHRCGLGITTDISAIAVNPDTFFPCEPESALPPPPPAVSATSATLAALRSEARLARHASQRRGHQAGLRRAAWLPPAEHDRLAVYAQALRRAQPDGPHRGAQVRREPLYQSDGALDQPRCRTAGLAGFLRLHQRAVGHAAYAANSNSRYRRNLSAR